VLFKKLDETTKKMEKLFCNFEEWKKTNLDVGREPFLKSVLDCCESVFQQKYLKKKIKNII